MRVIVVGAAGSVGRQLLEGLADHKAIDTVISMNGVQSTSDRAACAELGIECRRVNLNKDLSDQFRYSDAVVFAGWSIGDADRSLGTSRLLESLANVCGSAARANVRTFVYGSSALGYSEGPQDAWVDEFWPLAGDVSSPRALQIARGEELVDEFDTRHEIIRVVVLRPALVVCPSRTPISWRERLGKRVVKGFVAGPRIRLVPRLGPDEFQVVHGSDLVEAFCLAVTGSVVGKFNLAADPITSDMLAEAFRANVRVPPTAALKLHSYARQLGLAALDTATLRLGLQIPLLSTGRARTELGWSPEHSGLSILEEWACSFASTAPDVDQNEAALEEGGGVELIPKTDVCDFYQRSLDLFGQCVHAIRDDQWSVVTDYDGWSVMEMVVSVARQQYQTSLQLRGATEEEIERQLPADPLGFSRAEGWDLAAERGTLAVREDPVSSLLEQVLPDVICDITLRGWFLAEAIGFESTVDPELNQFVETRVGTIDDNETVAHTDATFNS